MNEHNYQLIIFSCVVSIPRLSGVIAHGSFAVQLENKCSHWCQTQPNLFWHVEEAKLFSLFTIYKNYYMFAITL